MHKLGIYNNNLMNECHKSQMMLGQYNVLKKKKTVICRLIEFLFLLQPTVV